MELNKLKYSPLNKSNDYEESPSFRTKLESNSYDSYQSGDESVESEKIEEPSYTWKISPNGFKLFLLLNGIFALVVITLMVTSPLNNSSLLSSKNDFSIHEDPMSIEYDDDNDIYVVYDNDPVIKTHATSHILATGSYLRNVSGNGWNYLSIETVNIQDMLYNITLDHKLNKTKISTSATNEEYFRTMRAAGYLEGYLTCKEMRQWYVNFYSGLFDGGDPTDESLEFLEQNFEWMKTESEARYRNDSYWMAVKGLISQLEGMVVGIKDGCPGTDQSSHEDIWATSGDLSFPSGDKQNVYLPSLHRRPSLIHILIMNANGDLYQIAEKFDQRKAPPSSLLNDYINDDDETASSTSHHKNSTQTKVRHQRRHLLSADDNYYLDIFERNPAKKSVGKTWNRSKFHASKTFSNWKHELTRQAKEQVREKAKDLVNKHTSKKSSSKSHENPHTLTAKSDRHRRLKKYMHETDSQSTKVDHCSAIIKLLDDKSDIVFGHNTWDDFQCASPRVFKHYLFNLIKDNKPHGLFDIHFSSSPGLLSSIDDFYIINGNSHLAVIETS